MEDKRRILEMVREGVLSPEEALELLAVLEERERPEAEAPAASPAPGHPQIRILATGANLEVRGVAGLAEPEGKGGTLAREEEGYLYRVAFGEGALRVPEGVWLALEARGSNVELARVALRGRALGANLEGEALVGLDLDLVGGNLEAGLLLWEGEHRLLVQAGNAELRFLPGSDLLVEAEARLGQVEAEGPWRRVAGPGGFRGVLGEGRARLSARVRMGNLELEA
ncbi:SHOCT-like domain-containing protein [Thermus thermamylovorans]|uniref:YvlB/LiaX N-terminal domain-containing protein n=1 Tax=Thermus thermamylovorans TaxID=2509362 RepID=A0A4Q9B0G0_9DEIN|nr:hypothetical protein ETP66_08635 [Thermus thermamylovorans]